MNTPNVPQLVPEPSFTLPMTLIQGGTWKVTGLASSHGGTRLTITLDKTPSKFIEIGVFNVWVFFEHSKSFSICFLHIFISCNVLIQLFHSRGSTRTCQTGAKFEHTCHEACRTGVKCECKDSTQFKFKCRIQHSRLDYSQKKALSKHFLFINLQSIFRITNWIFHALFFPLIHPSMTVYNLRPVLSKLKNRLKLSLLQFTACEEQRE